MKEKAALETSLASITSKKTDSNENATTSIAATNAAGTSSASSSSSDNVDQLRMQISTLMNSLATLSAEKSKMEASFQADKRTLRNDAKVKDQIISELQEKLNGSAAQTKLEVEKVKSKLIIERHEWEVWAVVDFFVFNLISISISNFRKKVTINWQCYEKFRKNWLTKDK